MSSYTSENFFKFYKPKCESIDTSTIRTSDESHIYWKKHLLRNPLVFRIHVNCEADNEKGNSSVGKKTTNIYKQNALLNGYHIESELEDALKSGFSRSPLGYDNVDWFVDEVINLENKMAFYFKNTTKDIIMKQENEEDYRNNNICPICEKKY